MASYGQWNGAIVTSEGFIWRIEFAKRQEKMEGKEEKGSPLSSEGAEVGGATVMEKRGGAPTRMSDGEAGNVLFCF